MERQEEGIACFKAYDVRGRVPDELNEELARSVGRAYAAQVRPRGAVAVGRDVRPSSAGLARALTEGLVAGGVDVADIGVSGTEMVYFAASRDGMGGGIMVTASHNPPEYNGLKFVREGARPISGDTGLFDIESRILRGDYGNPSGVGTSTPLDILQPYLETILSFVDRRRLRPLTIVANAGNGGAGPILDRLAPHLPFSFVKIHHEPDGSFPNGVPNPMIEENRSVTAEAVRDVDADLGVAWDGDFDRCFFFDGTGAFVEGYYIVGLLAERMLGREPASKIIHDPRLTWNTIDVTRAAGGIPVQWKTGHAFMKEKMRAEDALYGGEMSAHHYFRDFTYCDSGIIPWLLVAAAISETGRPLAELVAERQAAFPCSGEINSTVLDPAAVIADVRARYTPLDPTIEEIDGLSMAFGDAWRFNLRESNTEPTLRLNVESRADEPLMREKTEELIAIIRA